MPPKGWKKPQPFKPIPLDKSEHESPVSAKFRTAAEVEEILDKKIAERPKYPPVSTHPGWLFSFKREVNPTKIIRNFIRKDFKDFNQGKKENLYKDSKLSVVELDALIVGVDNTRQSWALDIMKEVVDGDGFVVKFKDKSIEKIKSFYDQILTFSMFMFDTGEAYVDPVDQRPRPNVQIALMFSAVCSDGIYEMTSTITRNTFQK